MADLRLTLQPYKIRKLDGHRFLTTVLKTKNVILVIIIVIIFDDHIAMSTVLNLIVAVTIADT